MGVECYMSSAERVRRHRERKRVEEELRKRCEALSRELLERFPGRDAGVEAGRLDRALRYLGVTGGLV